MLTIIIMMCIIYIVYKDKARNYVGYVSQYEAKHNVLMITSQNKILKRHNKQLICLYFLILL